MSGETSSALEALARAAAEEVAGSNAVETVEVRRGADFSERPVYYFSFAIDQGRG